MDCYSEDSLFQGKVIVRQSINGYRFSIDAVLLAGHASFPPNGTVLDLGTGCGVIPLMLAYLNRDLEIYGIEIQEELANMAEENVRANKLEDRIHIVHGDLKHLHPRDLPTAPDLVICNPPFWKIHTGRLNPDSQKAVARHEIKANISDITDAARRVLQLSGSFLAIFPAERILDLLCAMRSSTLEPKYIRMIHSREGSEAKLLIVEGKKGGGPGCRIDSPLIVYGQDGKYTREVLRYYEG